MDKEFQVAKSFDESDELKHYRNKFIINDNLIYLDGNSLGRLPKITIEINSRIVKQQWGTNLIRSWNDHWLDLSSRLSHKIAKIVGAREDEIFVGDSTSLNFFKLVHGALTSNKSKSKIITDCLNFPSNLYVLQGVIENHFPSISLEILDSNDGITMDENLIEKNVDKDTALISLSYVTYKSSFLYDMKRINQLANEMESHIIWDLSHAVGAVPINLNESGATMAVGCTYKYLNGGPGSPAFVYVRKDVQNKIKNPISSWFGHNSPFEFNSNFTPSPNIQKFAIGTPSILSLAAIEPGLDLALEAGTDRLRSKSIKQSEFLIDMIGEHLVPLGFRIGSPKDCDSRGSHISIQHPESFRISRALIEPIPGQKIIIPDFRPPNNIRIGITPLYLSFKDLVESVFRIKSIVITKEFKKYRDEVIGVS